MTKAALQLKYLTLFCVMLVLSPSVINGNTTTVSIAESTVAVPSLQTLCPYSPYCKHGPARTGLDANEKPCCAKCSCHQDCWVIESCCPDKNDNTSDRTVTDRTDVRFPCQSQFMMFNRHRGIYSTLQTLNRYKIIDRCFKSQTNESCFNDTIIEDYIMVSDADNEFVFKNRKCAACNGFLNVTSWNLVVTCQEMFTMQFTSVDEIKDYILLNCELGSFPPNPEIGLSSICPRNVIDSCKPSREWDIFDQDLVDLCASFQQLYLSQKVDGDYIYGNVYCFLCNKKQNDGIINICPLKDDDAPFKDLYPTSLFGLMNMAFLTRSSNRMGVCRPDEFLDKFTEPSVCRKLVCPPANLPSDGECNNVIQSIVNYGIHIVVRLSVGIELATALRDGKDAAIINPLRVLLEEMFDIAVLNCGKCNVMLYEDVDYNNNGGDDYMFYIRWVVSTSRSCSIEALIEKYLSHQAQSIFATLSINDVKGDVILNGTLAPELPKELKKVTFAVYQRCGSYISIEKTIAFLECPRVQLTKNETEALGLNVTAIQEETSGRHFPVSPIRQGHAPDLFLVCKQFYFNLFNEINGTVRTMSMHMLIYVFSFCVLGGLSRVRWCSG